MNDATMIIINEKPRGVIELMDRVLKAVGEDDENYFTPLDDHHSAVYLKGSETLFVSFERAEEAATSPAGTLFAQEVHTTLGWSSLSLITEAETWFRAPSVYEFFDNIVDAEWFEDFDRVILYGAGMSGYAACAFGVTAPGATVLAFNPQATLDPMLAGWDTRFSTSRRLDFTSRFGYAPHMCEAADAVHVFFDPYVTPDASHAAQFNHPHVTHHRLRHYGENPAAMMRESGELLALLESVAERPLTARDMGCITRKRHKNITYIRRILSQTSAMDRPFLSALICRFVNTNWGHAPRFKKRLKQLEKELAAEGRTLPAQVASG